MQKNIKWLKYSFKFIILFISIIIIFNYKVDSLGLFGNSFYLSQVAKELTNGNMVAGLKNIDERLLQKLIIKNLKIKNDVIVIGSSRSMKLRKKFFKKDEIQYFNHSVSGASLEDYIAILGIYESIHRYLPSTIILGIDPWIFNKYNNQKRWKTLTKYYNFEINKIYNEKQDKVSTLNTNKYKQLINYDYTISNIKFYKTLLKNDNKVFYITKNTNINDLIIDTDGSRYSPYKSRYPNSNQIKKDSISFTKAPVYSLEKFTTLSNVKLFENFIKYLKNKNINIILYLNPYNPITYDILNKNKKFKYIDLSEEYLNKISIQNNLLLKGSYNPHKYDFSYVDFSDGMHGLEIVAKTIFKE